MRKTIRVLHGLCNAAGQAGALAAAEREVAARDSLPFRSWSVDFYPGSLQFQADEVIAPWRCGCWYGKLWRKIRCLGRGLQAPLAWDVFHFYGGDSFTSSGHGVVDLNLLDAAVLRKLGKRCFVTFQGSDARLSGSLLPAAGQAPPPVPACGDPVLDPFKRRKARRALRYCDRVFCLNPDLVSLVPGSEFVPYASVDPRRIAPRDSSRHDGRTVVLHAPTNRPIKGTERILQALEQLKQSYPVDVLLVEGLPHEEALRMYRRADILIDQIRIGWYGALAVELMAMQIPVVAYIDEKHLGHLPAGMRAELPVVSATPETLESVLDGLLQRPRELTDLGRKSRNYVENWHDPLKIARGMLGVYQDPSRRFWEMFG